MYNPDAYNPYACNTDEDAGPTFLAKYVSKSKQIPACPEEPFLRPKGSFWPQNYWSGYWYPMSLVFTPQECWNAAATDAGINNGTVLQKPQKLSKVKYPDQKVVIIDRKTYHSKVVMDTNATATGQSTKDKKDIYVTAGFADGHAAYRATFEMYDSDVNWTGRFNVNNPDTYVKGRAGVAWKDFK